MRQSGFVVWPSELWGAAARGWERTTGFTWLAEEIFLMIPHSGQRFPQNEPESRTETTVVADCLIDEARANKRWIISRTGRCAKLVRGAQHLPEGSDDNARRH